jgi:hypothetical protein
MFHRFLTVLFLVVAAWSRAGKGTVFACMVPVAVGNETITDPDR